MTTLVTGGAGFIGSHFIELLLARTAASVVCLDEFNDYYDPAIKRQNIAGFAENPRVTVVEQSFCGADAMRRLFEEHDILQVMHLGAYAGVRPSIEQPGRYFQANVNGTLNLLEAARPHKVRRFVVVSSSTVYGKDAAAPFSEDAPLGIPLSPYGASKQAAELIAKTYHVLHGLNIVCVRPFSVYGPRVRPDLAVAIFTRAILDGRPLPLFGDGSIRRDFTYVTDICEGLWSALTVPGIEGESINLGNDQPVTVRGLIAILEQALGRKALIDQRREVPGEMPVTHADLSKARRLLSYDPTTSLEDGIAKYVAWVKENAPY
jgi:UDP-glucuronate 4-epimerase